MLKTISDAKKSSIALVYPGNSFLAKPLCQALLHYHCQVIAVAKEFAENLLPLFDQEGFSFCYFADFEKNPPQEVDYLFELDGNGEFLTVAKKYQAKYAAVLEEENNQLIKKTREQKLDFRITIGHQLFGPGMNLETDNFIPQGLKAGVEVQTLKIPGNGLGRIYPLTIDDFVAGAVKAMFVPGTSRKTFEFFGQPITIFSFLHLIKEATKGESKVEYVEEEKMEKIKPPDLEALKSLKEELDWQPKEDLKKAIRKTVWEIKEQKTTFKEASKSFVGRPKDIKVKNEFMDKEKVEVEEIGEGVIPPVVDLAKKQEKIRLLVEQTQKTPSFVSSLPSSPSLPSTPKASPSADRKPWRFLKIFFLILLLLTLTLAVPFVFLAFKVHQGVTHLQKAKTSLQLKDLKTFQQEAKKAQNHFVSAQSLLTKTEPILEFVKAESAYFLADSWLSLGKQAAAISILGSEAADKAISFSQKLLASQPVELDQFVNQENQLLSELITEISLLQTKLEKEDTLKVGFPFFTPQENLHQLKKVLPQVKTLASTTKETLPLLSSLLAKDSRRTYLVLFQNNMELRPTGGFLGSFGLLTFEKARFLDFGVLDVYTADGQLKGHVEPPEKLKEYLGEAGWYLRDSNWDPDFPSSAQKAAWFLEKEMGRTVDGVIAINLNFAQKILTSLGEVFLPDYEEKINTANLFERAEYHSEIGTFPGSTQKSDFLGSLANAIFEKIKTGEKKDFLGVAKAIYQSLEEQDLLVYLEDQKARETIRKYGWSGEISPPITYHLSPITYPDYLMLVEANVGVNKANYFINRKIDQKIEIDQEGKVVHHLKIVYQNTARTETWPAGKYKNYLRIYTPKGSKIQDTKLEEFTEHGKTVLGTLIEIPIGEEKTVEISYELPEKLPQKERASYLFFFQKQPGMINTTNSLLFSFPVEIKPLLISPAGAYSPGSLLFTDSLSKSRTYRVEFVR